MVALGDLYPVIVITRSSHTASPPCLCWPLTPPKMPHHAGQEAQDQPTRA